MLLVRRTLPYLLLKAFCDKIRNVGDMFVSGFVFLQIFTKACDISIERLKYVDPMTRSWTRQVVKFSKVNFTVQFVGRRF